MAIKRFIAEKDATITNSFRSGFFSSGSLGNTGRADSLQTHVIYGQTLNTASNELARILVEFPTDDILTSIQDGIIPSGSGNQEYWLRMFNVEHPETLPKDFTLVVYPITASWEEGDGLDLDNYTDLGAVNWVSSSNGTAWGSVGGDLDPGTTFTQSFVTGLEDVEINISPLVDRWLDGSLTNDGLMVAFTPSLENGGKSYFKKMFSSRGSEYFFNRPIIEVRWDNSIQDDRSNSYVSSALASGADNTNTLYLYNRIRGTYKNIPNIGYGDNIFVSLYSSSAGIETPLTSVTGGLSINTGIYTASFNSTYSGTVYDIWHNNAGVAFYTGTVSMKKFDEDYYSTNGRTITSCTNLQPTYFTSDNIRFRFYTRKKNWDPNNYVVVTSTPETQVVEEAYYKISRVIDDKEVIRYGTGSLHFTRLSYDVDGNYFDIEGNLFEPGYQYKINLLYKIDEKYLEQPENFKFRVESI